MNRRISIWGVPCSGKSTIASWLFANLKIAGYNIQFVAEEIKRWAYQKRPVLSFDQLYLTSCQITAEDELLRSGVQYTITDCPCMLSYFYAKRNNLGYAPLILEMGRYVEQIYPSFNIYLYRDFPYQTDGRYETEEEAHQLEPNMLEFLKKEYPSLIIASAKEKEKLLEMLDYSLRRTMSN